MSFGCEKGNAAGVFLYQVNVTRDCNLRCTHCYIHSLTKKASGFMTRENFVKIMTGIADHMQSNNHAMAEIHVIGGEPTMLGADFFKDVIPAGRRALDERGVKYQLILVSNLLSRELMDIVPLFDRINTSYEPVTRFPKPKLEQMWVDNFREVKASGIDVGVTTAVTKPVIDFGASNLLDRLYGFGFRQIHLGFFIASGDGFENKDTVAPRFDETEDFFIAASEWYFERREQPDLFVNPVESMISSIHTGEPLDDIVCPITTGSMDIDYDGNAATCLEAGGATTPAWEGNVLADGVKGVADSRPFQKSVMKSLRPPKVCMTCDEYQVCRAGCGVNHKHWDPETDKGCPGFKRFIKFIRAAHENGLRPKYLEYRGKGC